MRLVSLFVLASSALLAAGHLEKRIETLEAQMQDLRMQSVYGNYGAHTATAYPVLKGWGVSFSAEAIAWKFFEGGTESVFSNGNEPALNYHDRMQSLNFGWRPAYRFIAGYQIKDPAFDVAAAFTRFTTHQNAHTAGSVIHQLFPNQAVTPNTDFTGSSESWKISFNVLDLSLGRSYFLRRTFSAHPFIGVRGALIDQRNRLSWDGSTASNFQFKSTNNFFGVGLVAGSQGRWHFNANWSVFGSILGSWLYGYYDIQTKIQQYYPVQSTLLSLNSNTRRVVPNMTTDAGVRWEYPAFNRRTRFTVSAAYEFQYWWAQNQTLHTDAGTTYSWVRWAEDFGMQGVKLDVGLDF